MTARAPQLGVTFSAEWLANVIQQESCAFLCGAGASVPSGLPTAFQFIEHLITALLEACPIRIDNVQRSTLCQQRLEYVLQIATQTRGVDVVSCVQTLNIATPNSLHYSVARCLDASRQGTGALLTTNFDTLFEEAAGLVCRTGIEVHVGELLSLPTAGRIQVFKLHGTADPKVSGGVAATLNTIGRYFSDRSVEILDSVLHNRTVIVLGYSGNDHYDVMPYLMRHKYGCVVWLQHDSTIERGRLLSTVPPKLLRIPCMSPGLYARCDTPTVMEVVFRHLNSRASRPIPSLESPSTAISNWKDALSAWVRSLGPRSALFLGDLLLREAQYWDAIDAYRSGLNQLKSIVDADMRAKTRRNIGAAMTLAGHPCDAAYELSSAIKEETHASPAEKCGLMLEFALSQERMAGIAQLLEARTHAEACGSKLHIALANRNIGIQFLRMAVEENSDDHLETAFNAHHVAREIYADLNHLESLKSTAYDLGDCYILRDEPAQAVRFYTFSAWYCRATAYRDDGANLRFVLGLVISAAGFAEFMGTPVERLHNWQILASLGAIEVVTHGTMDSFQMHLRNPWQVRTTRDVLIRIREQANGLANGHLKDWDYAS